jgi:hypothetical protein
MQKRLQHAAATSFVMFGKRSELLLINRLLSLVVLFDCYFFFIVKPTFIPSYCWSSVLRVESVEFPAYVETVLIRAIIFEASKVKLIVLPEIDTCAV